MTLRQQIEARLKAEANGFKVIEGAASLQAVLKGTLIPPGCYIYRAKETTQPNTLAGMIRQRVDIFMACVVVSSNVKTAKGGDSSDDNEALCAEVRRVLLGWMPEDHQSELLFAGGQLVSFNNNLLIYQQLYKTDFFISA